MKRELSFAAGLIPAIFFSGSAEGEESPPLPATPSSQIEIQELEVDPAAIRFTPPPPPKPAPAVALTRASTIEKGTHALILAVGEPSTLPDISPPPSPLPDGIRPPFPAKYTKPEFFLGLSTVVYRDGHQTVSHLSWRDPQTLEHFEAWCSWDWSLLGPLNKLRSAEADFNLLFAPIVIDVSRWPEGAKTARKQCKYVASASSLDRSQATSRSSPCRNLKPRRG